ncbi:MAG: flagellar basal body rod protein FlgC [Balneolales bacterium]|nr:flagellar basal body rod protein FlgC [Balneolales bacterium]
MLPDRLSSTFQTASEGLALQRKRIEIASRNIANARTSAEPGTNAVYRPQEVVTKAPESRRFLDILEGGAAGLRLTDPQHMSSLDSILGQARSGLGPSYEVVEKEKFKYEYDPNHPHADENGMVKYPDVDMVKEMAEMVSANRLYEANLSSIEAEKELLKRSLEI